MKFKEKRMQHLLNSLIGIISQNQITYQHIIFNENQFQKFKLLVINILNPLKNYLNSSDVHHIIFSKLYDNFYKIDLERRISQTSSASLKDLLGEDKIKLLAEEIINYFESIPCSYTIKINLPCLDYNFFEGKDLTSEISFSYKDNPTSGLQGGLLGAISRSLLNEPPLPSKNLLVEISYAGFIENTNSKGWDDTYLTIKQFILLGIYLKIFKINNVTFYSADSNSNINLIEVLNIQTNESKPLQILPELQQALRQLQLNDKVTDNETLLAERLKQLGHYLKLLKSANNNDIKKIITGISWAFDAEVSNNQTFSYIQTFLGLEAILGFNNSKESDLVKKLAIRCSYLIANNHQDRSHINKRFIDLYELRSNLVHGTDRTLNEEAAIDLSDAKIYLKKVILKELTLINIS